jgi:hypothetical protein
MLNVNVAGAEGGCGFFVSLPWVPLAARDDVANCSWPARNTKSYHSVPYSHDQSTASSPFLHGEMAAFQEWRPDASRRFHGATWQDASGAPLGGHKTRLLSHLLHIPKVFYTLHSPRPLPRTTNTTPGTMSLILRDPFRTDDFFAPFFSGWPFETGALTPTTGTTQQVATRSMPVDVMEVRPQLFSPLAAFCGPRLGDNWRLSCTR